MTFEIIVPGRFLEPKDPVSLSVGVEGWYELAALKGGVVTRQRSFKASRLGLGAIKNLILNQGLDRYGTEGVNNLYGSISIGIGTTPPADTDTSLENLIFGPYNGGRTASRESQTEDNDWRSSLTITWLTGIGDLGDNNLTELGVGASQSESSLMSRALILDSQGSPVSFPITADEQLQVSYTLRIYPPLGDGIYELDINGVREVTSRALSVNAHPSNSGVSGWGLAYNFAGAPSDNFSLFTRGWYTGNLVGISDGNPSGSLALSNGSASNYPYIGGSYKSSGRVSWSPTLAVSNDLRTHVVGFGGCPFQVQYDPPIAKTNEQTMFLDYEFGWVRR